MRIAILTELFPPSIGGQEIRFAELAQALVQRGHSVEVFCIQNVPGTPQEETVTNVKIHRFPEAFNYQSPTLGQLRRRLLPLLRYALWCRDIPGDFDFVVFNEWPLVHVMLARPSIRSKAAVDWCESRDGMLFSLVQRYLPRMVRKNIANTAALKAKLQTASGCPFEFLPSGIFPERYRSARRSERNGILYLGRVTEHKNVPLLLSAFEALIGKGYTGPLRIAGSGPLLLMLHEWVRASTVANKIEVLGSVDEGAKQQLLANSEVLLLTSRREGFPRVVAEAMASGLPVVTADYAENGAKELVSQYGIGQVAVSAADAVSDAILHVLDKWDRYSIACIAASKSLNWETLVEDFLKIAKSVQRAA